MTPQVWDVFTVSPGFERNTIPNCRNKSGLPYDIGAKLANVLCGTPDFNCNDSMIPYRIVFLIVLTFKSPCIYYKIIALAFV